MNTDEKKPVIQPASLVANAGKATEKEFTATNKFVQKIGNHKPKFTRVGLKHQSQMAPEKTSKPK